MPHPCLAQARITAVDSGQKEARRAARELELASDGPSALAASRRAQQAAEAAERAASEAEEAAGEAREAAWEAVEANRQVERLKGEAEERERRGEPTQVSWGKHDGEGVEVGV